MTRCVPESGDGRGEGGLADRIDAWPAAWRRERPDLDVSAIAIVGRVLEIAAHIERSRRDLFAEMGNDSVAFNVLSSLRRAGPPYRLTVGQLRAQSLVTFGAVTQQVHKLESAGLVRRAADANDRRVVAVVLTDRGYAVSDEMIDRVVENDHALLEALDAPSRQQLLSLLRTWTGWIQDRSAEYPGTLERRHSGYRGARGGDQSADG